MLVIGSQQPWLEAVVLAAGDDGTRVTTVDYAAIRSEHPRVAAVTPARLATMYLEEDLRFDAVVSYSSVEHSGLGRWAQGFEYVGSC